MRLVERLTARQLFLDTLLTSILYDTSSIGSSSRQATLVAPQRACAGSLSGHDVEALTRSAHGPLGHRDRFDRRVTIPASARTLWIVRLNRHS